MDPDKLSAPPVLVSKDAGLRRLAGTISRAGAIAVDTESNSLFAHRERLCLIQISTSRRDYLVDPLADLDLSLLAPVLADPFVVKVFHDAEYDVLTLKKAYPFELAGIFDTKVAAVLLRRRNVGLAAILRDEFGVELDKKMQRSDWGERPLSAEQMAYARLDTHYLLELAHRLRAELTAAGPPAVLEAAAECRRLVGLVPEPRRFDPDDFAAIRGADRLDGAGRRRLRELFVMRERLAEQQDQPPFKVLGNEALLQLAMAAPESGDDLGRVAELPGKLARRYGDAILGALRHAARLRPIDRPPRRGAALAMTGNQRSAYERLRSWRRDVAERRRIDPSLLLARSVLEQLARLSPVPDSRDELAATGLLEAFRLESYGDDILDALAGRS